MPPVLSSLSNRRVDLVPDLPGLVDAVAPGSLAYKLGLTKGDQIVSINGTRLIDTLDFQVLTQSEHVDLRVAREGQQTRHLLRLDGDEFWGITFADATFDGVRICENGCPFCFIKQIPRGMRKSLYVMDDDYRYSMLYGSFVTLTNLTEDDWRRIETDRLGPLHVSVHATDPDLRVALVGNPKAANILDDLRRLQEASIDFHAQLVLCPGVNDGDWMDQSIADLATFQRCLSIAGVPVGLTKFGLERQSKQVRLSRTCMRSLPHRQINVRRYEPVEALAVIRQAERWQSKFRSERGDSFFYLGDEFYLMTGTAVPSARFYGGYPQIEDGIGITRHLLEDLNRYIRRIPPGQLTGESATVACGTLIGPVMQSAIDRLSRHTGADLELQVVVNQYFGAEINVSGLLTGSDLLAGVPHGTVDQSPVFVSNRMISDRTGTLLDDMTLDQLREAGGREFLPRQTLSEVAREIKRRQTLRKAA